MAQGWLVAAVAAGALTTGLGSALAGTPHVVTDLNAQVIPVSSFRSEFTDQGSWQYFDANDGIEPWITNGTAAGTFMWGHVAPPGSGVLGLQPLRAGTKAFVLYSDPGTKATTIWVTDGMPGGSRSLAPSVPRSLA